MAFDFQSRDAFLGRRGSPERIAPVAQGDSGFFVHRADSDRVLLFAVVTAPEEPGIAFPSIGGFHLIDILRLAMRTAWRTAPPLTLHEFHGGKFARAGQWNRPNDFRCLQVRGCLVLHGGNIILSAMDCQRLFLACF